MGHEPGEVAWPCGEKLSPDPQGDNGAQSCLEGLNKCHCNWNVSFVAPPFFSSIQKNSCVT